jgi:hypothetical protein
VSRRRPDAAPPPRGRVRFWARTLALAGTLAALTLGLLSSPAKAPAAASRFLSPRGSDDGQCEARSRPCRSVGYAYARSKPGEIVELAAGGYGRQAVPAVDGRKGPAVQFQPAEGASVSFGGLDVAGSHVTVTGIRTGDLDIGRKDGPVEDVTIFGGEGRRVWMNDVHDVALVGGSYGGSTDVPVIQIAGSPASSGVTLDAVDVHDAVASNAGVHTECFWAGGVQGLVVRNSSFRNCAYFDIFFTAFNGPDPAHVLIENTVLEGTVQSSGQPAPYAVDVSTSISRAEDFTFRHNTWAGDVAVQPGSVSGFRMFANVGEVQSCADGVEYRDNVWTAVRCGQGDRRIPGAMGQFADPARHDWRLRTGAAAIDAGSADVGAPGFDAAGLRRDQRADAGAYEHGGRAPEPNGQAGAGAPRMLSATLRSPRVCLGRSGGCDASAQLVVRSDQAALASVRVGTHVLRRAVRTGTSSIVIRAGALGLRRGPQVVTVWLSGRDGRASAVVRRTLSVA